MARDDVEEALKDLEDGVESISDNIPRVRLAEVAENNPEKLLPRLPELVAQLSSSERLDRNTAAGVIGHIGRKFPSEVGPYLNEISNHFDEPDIGTRQNLLLIFEGVAQENPNAVKPFIDDIINQLDDESLAIRVYAAVVIAILAEEAEDATIIGDQLCLLLTDVLSKGNEEDLHNLTYAIRTVSASAPTATTPAISEILPLLDSKHAGVRMNVTYSLGNMEAIQAKRKLKELLHDDDEDVRQAAQEAIENIPITESERTITDRDTVDEKINTDTQEIKERTGRSTGSRSGFGASSDSSERKRALRRSLIRGL